MNYIEQNGWLNLAKNAISKDSFHQLFDNRFELNVWNTNDDAYLWIPHHYRKLIPTCEDFRSQTWRPARFYNTSFDWNAICLNVILSVKDEGEKKKLLTKYFPNYIEGQKKITVDSNKTSPQPGTSTSTTTNNAVKVRAGEEGNKTGEVSEQKEYSGVIEEIDLTVEDEEGNKIPPKRMRVSLGDSYVFEVPYLHNALFVNGGNTPVNMKITLF